MRAITGQNGLAVGVVSSSDVGKTRAAIDNKTTGNPTSTTHYNSYTHPSSNQTLINLQNSLSPSLGQIYFSSAKKDFFGGLNNLKNTITSPFTNWNDTVNKIEIYLIIAGIIIVIIASIFIYIYGKSGGSIIG